MKKRMLQEHTYCTQGGSADSRRFCSFEISLSTMEV